MKYADDFNLLVPENSDVPVEDEMKHIISWSKSNKLFINLAKCKELVFWRPGLNLNSCQVFCQMLYVLLVVNYWVYLLIVICNLNFCQQVDQVVKVSSQRYYLLQQMRKQGLDAGCLQVVLQSIVTH